MKNTFNSLALLTLVGCLLFTGCSQSKKLQASKAQINQLKKDSIETHRKLDSKNSTAKNTAVNNDVVAKNPAVNNDVVAKNTTSDKTKSTTPLATYDTKSYVPLPPVSVEGIFKSKYPSASDVVWTKRMPLVKTKNANASDYKATFVLEGNNNSVIYSDKGELIERREQISPDQLPQNIHDAITKKYPDASIVSAASFKNSKLNGSYTAIIKSKSQAGEFEVILTENGVFVE